MRARELQVLVSRFEIQTASLVLTFDTHRANLSTEINDYSVVALQDAWTRFVRDLILSSATGRARGRDSAAGLASCIGPGKHGPLAEAESLQILQATWGKKRKGPLWEPHWYDQQESARAVRLLDLQNATIITGGLGAITNPIEELRCVRNFAAHRGRQAARSIEMVHGPRRHWRRLSRIVESPRASGTQLHQWVGQFCAVAAASTSATP